ncbi:MAG: hypothetical protein VW268_02710 [Rhodospirillaceae bacterium]
MVIRGNHDDEALFDRAFTDWQPVRDIEGLRFVCFRDWLAADRSPVRGDANRARFLAAVDDADSPAQIHVQHYMIDPPTFASGWKYEYVDAADYRDRINASGRVAAVLSGHYHPGSHLVSPEGVHYSVPKAFTSAPHPFRIVEVAVSGGSARVVGIGDRSAENGGAG